MTEIKMYRLSFAVAAAAVIFFSGTASAARQEFPEVRALKPVLSPLKAASTAQAKISAAIHVIDFDVFSSVNDPLYREGSRLLLERAVKEDLKKEKVPSKKTGADLRDAPISKTKPVLRKILRIRKTRVNKPVHTDPVKLKKSL